MRPIRVYASAPTYASLFVREQTKSKMEFSL
jgi:hypothetical protein